MKKRKQCSKSNYKFFCLEKQKKSNYVEKRSRFVFNSKKIKIIKKKVKKLQKIFFWFT